MKTLRLLSILSVCAAFAATAQAGALEDIQKSGVLKVCMWPDYYGISYRDPKTGWLQGIDIQLSEELAKDLGAKLEYFETDFSKVVSDVAAGKCQIAMMGVGVLPSRAEQVDFSAPYLRSDVYAVTTRSNRNLSTWDDIDRPGRVIVVQKGTFMEPLMQKQLSQATLEVSVKPGEREREVESGRADAFMTDYPYSKRMEMNTDWARVIAPTKPVQLTDYAYAVPKSDPAWLARVNEFVAAIKKDGRLVKAATPHALLPIVVKD
ncbi:MAG: amino acid ABC transporter substrate-binding protein [Burkholderiaceae bacterium]|jgi:ABC-type amino acid transport substrate-binding protein|nr:amino acid ABC transporter substrate-binding protein [Burkholderiaceae bacterium]